MLKVFIEEREKAGRRCGGAKQRLSPQSKMTSFYFLFTL